MHLGQHLFRGDLAESLRVQGAVVSAAACLGFR